MKTRTRNRLDEDWYELTLRASKLENRRKLAALGCSLCGDEVYPNRATYYALGTSGQQAYCSTECFVLGREKE